MEAYSLDICNRETGLLLQNKTFVPLNGPIFSVSNSSHGKSISFVHAAWNKFGTQVVAGDIHGNIYLFYLQKNRFSLIHRLKTCSCFLTFSNDKTQDIIVALTDCSIVSLSSDSRTTQKYFKHHTSCVVNISFDKNGQTVLSCSKDQAILWDLKTFNVQRVLTLKIDVDIVKVFFLPDNDIIISAFHDDSVFLWDFKNFKCMKQFLCVNGDTHLNLKSIDASRDGNLLACAGRANWFIVWNIPKFEKVLTVKLPENVCLVKQINFLSGVNDKYILSVLTADGDGHIFNLSSMEILHKLTCTSGKILSLANSINLLQIITISLQGIIELYDVEEYTKDEDIQTKRGIKEKKIPPKPDDVKELQKKKAKMKKREGLDIDKQRLFSVIKNFEEYPEKHRFFIWSQLLELPHNVEAFEVLHQDSLKVQPNMKDCSFMNPGVQKTFLRVMSMLICWYPVIQEIDHMQCVIFPFIKILHKNTIICFELLITLISNWCQNWFLFCPFPPFNILCVVENIISFHDQELMTHFIKQHVSAEVYAWPLLKTSFSEVFNKKDWLKLWDNIFSNSLSFCIYAVAAFNIVMRDALLKCNTLEQFKSCYRKHGISASVLLKKTYSLQQISPTHINPESVVGKFSPIPKGAYPTFFQISQMKIDLETLTRKKIIDQEIDYLKQREDYLEIKSNYLKELQELQMLRRKLLLETIELKGTDAMERLDTKLKTVQVLIQDNLTNQVGMLKGTIGEDIFAADSQDAKKQHFLFQDYIKKLRGNNK